MFSHAAFATHNRAGEITYRQIGPLTIEATITTYTKASSTAADRDSLDLFWGDGTSEFVKRDNSKTRFESNDVKVNFYIAQHTYPGVATYTISFLDPNRIGGILNVNYPNSIDIPFFLSTTFTLLDLQFQGFNNSVILLQPPLDIGCVGKLFIHNPNAYDADGDSLAYEFAVPLENINKPVPGYRLPNEIVAGIDNILTIDSRTGEIQWRSPKLQGEYNIAIQIKEYRNGRLINTILRDMQILIRACENDPPVIKTIDEICVIAGEKLVIPIEVDDPDLLQKVKLFATGGPFTVPQPARLIGPAFFTAVPFQASLEWQTTCNHISDQYYQIVLRAVDNFYPDSTGLAFLKTIRIKVVGPSPENLTAKSEDAVIKLEWENPYACEVTDNNYFQGFSVWRKISSQQLEYDTCNPGLTGGPYTKIVFKTTVKENGKYLFTDTNIEKGNTYCYRVQAEFAKLTSTNNPFNRVESLHSNEACLQLSRDVPLITKVSVEQTGTNNGIIRIEYTKPLPSDLDTIVNPGPYRYEIYRGDINKNFVLIPGATVNALNFKSVIDTSFFDLNLNTIESQFYYQVRFYTSNGYYGKSPDASSVFLTIIPSDGINSLSWKADVPWNNLKYKIYRQEPDQTFVDIATVQDTFFTDNNLVNGDEYCYRIESEGGYGISTIAEPLLNYSQINCKRPLDDIPPCPPDIEVINICAELNKNPDTETLFNTVKWASPAIKCPKLAEDIAGYNIYYAQTIDDEPIFIHFQSVSNQNIYFHFPDKGLLGCYVVTSVDSLGNESVFSNRICVDNCPFYELPNTFTPNNDGSNDLFRPRVNLFIAKVDFQVFNQWGNLVFETSDPVINWDGKTQRGKELADGTYYYTCRLFENRVTGVEEVKTLLSGFIHIIRN